MFLRVLPPKAILKTLDDSVQDLEVEMELVNNVNDRPWHDETTLPGARGFEFMTIVADEPEYTSAYGGELVRLGPEDHSVAHVERWNHLLYFLAGSGEVTIGNRTWPVRPGS